VSRGIGALQADDRNRVLLAADVAVARGLADPAAVAGALQRVWEGGAGAPGLAAALAIDGAAWEAVDEEVARLVVEAGGDAAAALARRGGLARTIFQSLEPETSHALLEGGAGVRTSLRALPTHRYREFSLIGKGGMGVVYLALDTELNRRVAFKMVRPDPAAPKETPAPNTPLGATPPSREDPEATPSLVELKQRVQQEPRVTRAMEHPGVKPVHELGRTEAGKPY
jgi:hypothetical protein